MRKKLIAFISAALAVTVSCSALSVIAAEDMEMQTNEDMSVSEDERPETVYEKKVPVTGLPDSEELERMYIEKLFYGDNGISLYADYGREKLKGLELEIYNELRAHIEAVANGTEQSTKFVTSVKRRASTIGSALNDAAAELYDAANAAVPYLMVDLPQDFYWFDKTSGYQFGADVDSDSFDPTDYSMEITLTVTFNASTDYMGANNTTVNPQKINAAKTAVANAKKIAAKYENLSAYEKILGYNKEICDLVSYNHTAAGSSASAVGINPWQLVWVFDGNSSTNVVCEGYAKAFQYLCDIGGVECYTVTGVMTGGTGAGGHMWNIVVLGGESYLVDITNCDSGSIGSPDKLLLKGATQSNAVSCVFANLGLVYQYYDTTADLYPASLLTVSTKDYVPTQSDPKQGDINGDGKINNTDIILLGRAYMAGTADKYLAIADMNSDGRITNADIILLGRLYMSQTV